MEAHRVGGGNKRREWNGGGRNKNGSARVVIGSLAAEDGGSESTEALMSPPGLNRRIWIYTYTIYVTAEFGVSRSQQAACPISFPHTFPFNFKCITSQAFPLSATPCCAQPRCECSVAVREPFLPFDPIGSQPAASVPDYLLQNIRTWSCYYFRRTTADRLIFMKLWLRYKWSIKKVWNISGYRMSCYDQLCYFFGVSFFLIFQCVHFGFSVPLILVELH